MKRKHQIIITVLILFLFLIITNFYMFIKYYRNEISKEIFRKKVDFIIIEKTKNGKLIKAIKITNKKDIIALFNLGTVHHK